MDYRNKQVFKNYMFPTTPGESSLMKPVPGSQNIRHNLANYITPIQFQRFRHDIKMWRDALVEAELAYYPQRVKLQRMYQDTVLNTQVRACLNRRKNLTLLRDFKICNSKGVESLDLKAIFRNNTDSSGAVQESYSWFNNLMGYIIDSIFFGYSLISLGDLINDSFPQLTIIKRWNVSPDRNNVSAYVYSLSGKKYDDPEFSDWHIYVPTPSDLGVSSCGYGLLYPVAYTEILLRNNMGYNADFNEVFNLPMTIGKTTKTEESERSEFFNSLRNVGSLRTILLDEAQDSIELQESKNVGTAYQSFENFDQRLEKKISKIILGHADALESIPGKLGSQQGDSPVDKALAEVQSVDGILVENVVNKMLIPRMRKLGFNIPIEYHYELKNDTEIQEIRLMEDESNDKVAGIAQKMFQSGLKMDAPYFTERTGIPCTEVLQPNINKNDNPRTIQ
jgi:phage gp29-like protein